VPSCHRLGESGFDTDWCSGHTVPRSLSTRLLVSHSVASRLQNPSIKSAPASFSLHCLDAHAVTPRLHSMPVTTGFCMRAMRSTIQAR
jgi:hypothetical protein